MTRHSLPLLDRRRKYGEASSRPTRATLRPLVQQARLPRMLRVSGCCGPRTRSNTSSSSANRSRAAAGSPACPAQRASSCRTVRGPGCSGPRTRSSTSSSPAYRSRAAAGSPASPVQPARLARAVRVSGCSAPRTAGARTPNPANRSLAVAGSPASPVQRASRASCGCQGAALPSRRAELGPGHIHFRHYPRSRLAHTRLVSWPSWCRRLGATRWFQGGGRNRLLVGMPPGNLSYPESDHQHQRSEYWVAVSVGQANQGALAIPTGTPQLGDTAADPHRNPTDETAHSGTLVMRVKGTENSRSAASMRVSWAVGVFSK